MTSGTETVSGSRESYDVDELVEIGMTVNGDRVQASVPARMLLSDFLRHELRLTGTHVGCEHGVCGACTVHLDGRPARSCLTLAVQADGCQIRTVEGLADASGELHPVQRSFQECHALQCGFCTPGFVMSIAGLIDEGVTNELSDAELRERLAGNLCRCTGYQNIVAATRRAIDLNDQRG
jgi:carbon-monoxide dehydrogenase small subunit